MQSTEFYQCEPTQQQKNTQFLLSIRCVSFPTLTPEALGPVALCWPLRFIGPYQPIAREVAVNSGNGTDMHGGTRMRQSQTQTPQPVAPFSGAPFSTDEDAEVDQPFTTVTAWPSPIRTQRLSGFVEFPVSRNPPVDVDTGIIIEDGQRLVFSARGGVCSGIATTLTGSNGPSGWAGWKAGVDAPLPDAPPFSLLGKLDGAYFLISTGRTMLYRGNRSSLLLRVNDWRSIGHGTFFVNLDVF